MTDSAKYVDARLTFLRLIVCHARTLASTNTYSRMLTQFLWTRRPTFRKLDRSDWLEYSSKVNSVHLKCELLFAIPANQSFTLKTSATTHIQSFLPQIWLFRVSVCYQCACPVRRGKKEEEKEGKKQREQLNSHSHGADCCLALLASRCLSPIRSLSLIHISEPTRRA